MMPMTPSNPDILNKKSGGGCLILFGLPFLCAGLVVMLSSLGLLPLKWEGGSPPPWFVGVPFGAIFATVGAALVLGRGGTIIDRRNRTVTTWWGLLVPFSHKQYSLDDYNSVTIKREVRRSKNSTYTVYPVRIEGGDKPISWEEPQKYQKAREQAERLATFMEMQVVDSTSGEAVIRAPGELDLSLREKMQQAGSEIEVPDPPDNMKTSFTTEGTRLIIETPPKGLRPIHMIPLGLGFLIPAFVLLVVIMPELAKDKHTTGWQIPLVMSAFMGMLIPFAIFILPTLSAIRKQWRVIASPESLRVERKGMLLTKAVEIPANELEELVLPKEHIIPDTAQAPPIMMALVKMMARGSKTGIRARSDNAEVSFGKGLDYEELRWLHAVITKMMTM